MEQDWGFLQLDCFVPARHHCSLCEPTPLQASPKRLCLQEEYLRQEGYSEDQIQEFVSQVCLACQQKP